MKNTLSQSKEFKIQNSNNKDKENLKDILFIIIKFFVIIGSIWIIFSFVFGVTIMQGEDMYPKIRDGDLMLYYRLQQHYYIGDVVIFFDEGKQYVGRIVAKDGDVVDISDDGGLYVNGSLQNEQIFYPTHKIEQGITFPYEVKQDCVFLLSDFRSNGIDSRSYGAVEINQLSGKIFTIIRRRGI